MLVTLLVLWVVVVPVLTLVGTYVVSGILGRRLPDRSAPSRGLPAEPVVSTPSRPGLAPTRTRDDAGHSRGREPTRARRVTTRGG